MCLLERGAQDEIIHLDEPSLVVHLEQRTRLDG